MLFTCLSSLLARILELILVSIGISIEYSTQEPIRLVQK